MAIEGINYQKVIMDPIHGCIPITQLEYEILQLPVMNRLHNIHHLGLAYMVYPSAKTSRFEHSLGVTHIASKMIYRILETASIYELRKIFKSNPESGKFKNDCHNLIQRVRLAALLHDVGHGPYSHVTEPFLREALKNDEREEALELFQCKKEELPAHEYFSYKIITDPESGIGKITEKYGIRAMEIAELLIKKETKNENVGVLRKIISSQLDADRMDSLLRDSHATGVPFGITDVDRVIHNLYLQKVDRKYELVVHERALRGIEDIIDARFKMHLTIYNHHLVVALEELLREAIREMIKANILTYENFHYKSFFLYGESDDILINFKLREYKNELFKGLVDRHYAPVSLFKTQMESYDFIERTRKLKVEIPHETAREKIFDWFDKYKMGEIKFKPRRRKLKNILLFPSIKPFSPYKELSEEERILVGKGKNEVPRSLLAASPYVTQINELWRKYPYFCVSYVLPNVRKDEAKKYREEILKLIATKIAE
jgi:HD superfamily phosphohydrolase